ncbi:MAG: proprotein convertase P-domain-containing protein [Phaeodactylibacter sp.]|nr:proprotein convertase P-domain-containing protein [Phaeodactylibacter sp.]MCB9276287.1 proprotein convertase P-domain-containing protein [Lewinellaceae bacterium]
MKRLSISFFVFFLYLHVIHAQVAREAIANSPTPLNEVELVALPLINNEALLEAELARRGPGVAPRFAEAIDVDITPERYGLWEMLPGGKAVWRLRIRSDGAHSLNFGFLEYYMPPGAELLIYTPEGRHILGPFTPSDNEPHQQLWTPVLPGDEAVLEIQAPVRQREYIRLRLATVNHDFLGFLEVLSGACNLDVICGAGNGWSIVDLYRDVIQSVAVYGLGGDTFCTGFLINNTRQDCTPYFMTAHHCGVTAANAPSLVAYWNYQNSYCRQPGSMSSGGPGDGQLNSYNTGSIFRASYAASDFTLVELDSPVPNASNAYFSGWSRESTPPQDTLACIHHPDGAEKRISFSFHDAYPGSWGSGSTPVNNGNHLIIPDWDIGSTEDGSSGAPLFNRQRRIVGQLHGGAASCSNNQYDSFGWFRYSWVGGGSSSTRLKDWLDPDNTGLAVLDGHWLSDCTVTVTVASPQDEVCLPGTVHFEVETAEAFTVPVFLSTQGLPPGASATFSPNPAPAGSTANLSVTFPGPSLPSGAINFLVVGQGGGYSATAEASFSAISQLPAAPALATPANGEVGMPLAPAFQWAAVPLADSYDLQVASDSAFNVLVATHYGLTATNCEHVVLNPISTYYARVRANNVCGSGPWSASVHWTTSATTCLSNSCTAPPQPISSDGISVAYSEIYIPEDGTVASISVSDIDIDHSYVGDLSAFLRSPSGTTVQLFHRPGVPAIYYGCWGSGLQLGFNDGASLTQADFELSCDLGPPAIEGVFQPLTPLSALIGEPVAGTWRLTVIDHQDQDGGQLNGWRLNLCRAYPREAKLFGLSDVMEACTGQASTTDIYIGAGFESPVSLHMIGLPQGASVTFAPNPALPGQLTTATFSNFSQAGSFPLILHAADSTHNFYHLFQAQASELPETPLLFTPDDESPLFQGSLFFSWSPAPNADTFLIEIATDMLFGEIVKKDMVAENYYTLLQNLPGGAYFWRVTAINRCGGQVSTVFSFYLEGTTGSTGSLEAKGTFLVYPNPADDVLNIEWQGDGTAPEATASMYTITAKQLGQTTFRGSAVLAVDQLPAGIYALVIEAGGERYIRRIVVQ